MLLWFDQPAFYTTATKLQRWTAQVNTTTVVTTPIPRTGTACIASSNSNTFIYKTLGSDGAPAVGDTTAILGLRFRTAGLISTRAICGILDAGVTQVSVRINLDGTLSVMRGSNSGTVLGTTTYAVSVDTWYYLELATLIHASTGTIDLLVDGDSKLSLTGQNTRATANTSWNGIAVGGTQGGGNNIANIYVTDVYVLDGLDGTSNGQRLAFNTALGDRKVEYLSAEAGDGTHGDFTPSTGTDNGAMVDDGASGPDGDTTYNSSGTPGDQDSYTLANLATTSVAIDAVAPVYSITKDDAGSRMVRPLFVISASDYTGASIQAPSSGTYQILTEIVTASPATTSAWTPSEVNAMEVGVEIVS